MQIDAQVFLPIAEKANALAFVDIETSNLNADFGTVVVVSIKPYGQSPVTFTAKPGRDKALLKAVSAELAKYPVWITFYGKLFDMPVLQSRLVRHGLLALPRHHHIDIYFVVCGDELTFLTAREVLQRITPAMLMINFSDVEVAH